MLMKSPLVTAICYGFFALAAVECDVSYPYYGARIGKFSTHFHEVRGDVYAVDDKTVFIKGFNYDGNGPDAFFWAGTSVRPDSSGFVVPDDKGSLNGLSTSYHDQDLVLRLPVGKDVTELRWLSIWSKSLGVNFGSLIFPKNVQPPRPAVIGPLESTSHGVSSGPITVLDTQTFLVPDFTYDGTGKNVFWWLSRGLKPNTGGIRLRDENGSELPLKQYSKKTVVISVPEGHLVYDYDSLSVWSEHDVRDYGFVKLPRDILVPPSPRALGIALENKLNCEMLNDDLGFEVRWVINGDQLIMQLVSKIDPDEYMAFGLSSDDTETKFASSDAAIAWLGPKGQGRVVDYFLMSTDKCENGRGMCPDSTYEGASNSITLMNTAKVNNYVMITFRRPLKAADKKYDQHVYTDGPQAVLWAIGKVAEDGKAETPRLRTRGNLLLDFGREPMWNCPSPGSEIPMSLNANNDVVTEQNVPHVNCPTDLTFRAQLGPSNHPADRIWYINGLPTPILTVQRGQIYTFLVEGGTNPPVHHPFYITSSEEGGLYQKVLERKEHEEIVFAGVTQDPATGGLLPTAEGRLCEWSSASMREEPTAVTSTYGIGNLPLELSCGPGSAGKMEWLPDSNTSDVVYYQSFTGRNMGGIIRVVDWCEETDPEGYLIESGKKPKPHSGLDKPESELERESESLETGEARRSVSAENVTPFYGEFQQIQEQKTIPQDVQSEEQFPVNGEGMTEERIMNLQRGSQEKKKIDDFAKKAIKEPLPAKATLSESSYLRDEPDVSDIVHLKTSGDEESIQRMVFVQAHNVQNDAIKPHYRPLHLGDEQPAAKPPPNFSVHFESGFVPLIRHPAKEKESTDIVVPSFLSNQRGGPQRPFPFDVNESVPFHGTFKPGVPDFSGFNISHYTQAPDTTVPNHSPEKYQGLHSAPKPHTVQRPVKPEVGHPQELFLRPHRPFPGPSLGGYGPRPPLFHPQRNQHVLAQLPIKHRPDVFGSGVDDLDAGSSQRVQVSLQNTGSEKVLQPEVLGVPTSDIKYHNGRPVKLVASAPPIQRRPDIVDEEDVALHAPQSSGPSYNNFQPQIPPGSEASQTNGQYNLIPQMRPQRPVFPFRRPLPMGHPPLVNLHRFPPGINPRPQFINRPDGINHPQPLTRPLRPNVFPQHIIRSRPLAPHRISEESASDEVKEFSSEVSLETPEGNFPKDEVILLPSRENFGQIVRGRPPVIPAPSPSKFPAQVFLQRPLNINGEQEPQTNAKPIHLPVLKVSDDRFIPHGKQGIVAQNPSPKPHVIQLPSSEENEADELDIEESQDSFVEAPHQSDYDTPDLPYRIDNLPTKSTESIETHNENPDVEGGGLDHSLDPEHTFENYDKVPGPFDVTQGDYYPTNTGQENAEHSAPKKGENEINVIEDTSSESSIHLPDEHLGEDNPVPDGNIQYGQRLKPSPDEYDEDPEKRITPPSNRPIFFPVRRQPQFSSAPSSNEPAAVTVEPIQRVKITVSPTTAPKVSAWPGRKNILPSDGIDGHRISESVPSKRLEEIQLPEISHRPVAHDNGTDYSILTHVLSLISGSPEPMDIIEPRTAT